MTTLTKTPPRHVRLKRAAGLPPLNAGDHLTRPEFERLYEARPEIKKAELIEGTVYMTSPVRTKAHSQPHAQVMTWLGNYRMATPGVILDDNATLWLDLFNEVQPDAIVRLDEKLGGHCREAEDDYLEGPPELVVEVAASSAAYDLHEKKRVYARSGVPEYLAIQVYEEQVDWFALQEGGYAPLPADDQGILRSQVFPGLWLDPETLWSADWTAMHAVLQAGLASEEHADFVARLKEKQL